MTYSIYVLDIGKITYCRDYQLYAYQQLKKNGSKEYNYDTDDYKFKLILDDNYDVATLIRDDGSIGGYIGLYEMLLVYLKDRVNLKFSFKTILDKLYTYKFLSFSNDTLLRNILDNPEKLNYVLDSTFIVKSDRYKDSDVKKHISNRIPVYYGKVKDSYYNEIEFNNLLDGITSNRLKLLDSLNPIYVVCGPMMSLNRELDFCGIHCWGLNFETKTTRDYNRYISKDGSKLINIDELEWRLRDTIRSIFVASQNFHKGNYHILRIPYIGLGCYLSGINNFMIRDLIKRLFFRLLKEETNKNKNIHVVICNPDQSFNKTILDIEDEYKNNNYFNFDKDLFKLDLVRTSWVNAWDSHSFIGNGGSRDASIDGWFVSGLGPNNEIGNASYLHNIVLFSEYKNKILSIN